MRVDWFRVPSYGFEIDSAADCYELESSPSCKRELVILSGAKNPDSAARGSIEARFFALLRMTDGPRSE
jgi:hypothetical protein